MVSPLSVISPPSITEQRAAIGLTTPSAEEREYVWSQLDIPQARITTATGGYRVHRIIKRFHDGPQRYSAEGGGLRGGKSLGSAAEGIAWLSHSNLIWLAAETYDLTRQEFEYMVEGSSGFDWVADCSMPSQKYMPCSFTTPWGCEVQTRSLHDLGAGGQGASLVARAPDLIIICEPGFAPPEALQQAKERLTTRRGRLWMAGTFEKANTWYVDLWRKWAHWPNADMGRSLAVPSWLNTASFPGGRHDPEIEAMQRSYPTLREFLVRWGGVPMTSEALVMGAYWDERKHVSPNASFQAYDADGNKTPVELAIDPGFSGSKYAVEVIQRFGSQWNVIDEVIGSTLVHEEVIDLCRARPWWPNVSGGIIDPRAGVNHVYAASPQEIWWRHGHIAVHPSARESVEDITSRLQFMLRDPVNGRSHVMINPRCERLRYEMLHWRRTTTREGMGKPSDSNCDAIKALAYYASARYRTETLGYNPNDDGISVHDFSMGREPQSLMSKIDRYANHRPWKDD